MTLPEGWQLSATQSVPCMAGDVPAYGPLFYWPEVADPVTHVGPVPYTLTYGYGCVHRWEEWAGPTHTLVETFYQPLPEPQAGLLYGIVLLFWLSRPLTQRRR